MNSNLNLYDVEVEQQMSNDLTSSYHIAEVKASCKHEAENIALRNMKRLMWLNGSITSRITEIDENVGDDVPKFTMKRSLEKNGDEFCWEVDHE